MSQVRGDTLPICIEWNSYWPGIGTSPLYRYKGYSPVPGQGEYPSYLYWVEFLLTWYWHVASIHIERVFPCPWSGGIPFLSVLSGIPTDLVLARRLYTDIKGIPLSQVRGNTLPICIEWNSYWPGIGTSPLYRYKGYSPVPGQGRIPFLSVLSGIPTDLVLARRLYTHRKGIPLSLVRGNTLPICIEWNSYWPGIGTSPLYT